LEKRRNRSTKKVKALGIGEKPLESFEALKDGGV
jgi:hypothetical protein